MKKVFLSLGDQPLANEFKKRKTKTFYNLKLSYDTETKLVSINKRFNKEIMFNKTYPYRSSESSTVKDHFKKISQEIKKNYRYNKILEIGSNDGAFSKNFDKKKIVCVEPCLDVGNELKKKGFTVYTKYFDNRLTKKFIKEYQNFDIIFSANTITHIDNLNKVITNVKSILSDNGVFIIEEPSFLECFKKNAFDQFYNEHIYVLSAISLTNILKKNGLKILKTKNINVHGGSLRYYICKEQNHKFKTQLNYIIQIRNEKKYNLHKLSSCFVLKKKVQNIRYELRSIFKKIKKLNKIIVGYGASAKAVTVLNFCNLKSDYIDYFLDTTKNKIGKYLPGTKILVKKYDVKMMNEKNYFFLGAWNFKSEIFKKEKKFLQKGGKFILHLPKPKVVSAK